MLPWLSSHQLEFQCKSICSGSFICWVSSAPPQCCLTQSLPLPPFCHLTVPHSFQLCSFLHSPKPFLGYKITLMLLFPCPVVFASNTELASLPLPAHCLSCHLHEVFRELLLLKDSDCTTGKKMSCSPTPLFLPSNFLSNLFSPLLDIVAQFCCEWRSFWKELSEENGYKPNCNIIVRIGLKSNIFWN